MSLVDTSDAAKWKKYNSGTFDTKKVDNGFKKKMSYISYTQGSNKIKMEMYGYKTKKNKKVLLETIYYTKSGNNVKYYRTDKNGKKSKTESAKINTTLKTFYKNSLTELKKVKSSNNTKNMSKGSKLQYKYVYEYAYVYKNVYEPEYVYDWYWGDYRYEYRWSYKWVWDWQWTWKWV